MELIPGDDIANQGGRGGLRGGLPLTGKKRWLSGSESPEEQKLKPSWWQKLSEKEKVGLTLFVSILFVILATISAVLIANYVFYAGMLAFAAALGVSGTALPLALVGLVAALIAFEIPSLWNMKLLGAAYVTSFASSFLSVVDFKDPVKRFLWVMAVITLVGGAGLGLVVTAATPVLLSFLAKSLGVAGAYAVMAIATALVLATIVGLLGTLSFKRGKAAGTIYFTAWIDQAESLPPSSQASTQPPSPSSQQEVQEPQDPEPQGRSNVDVEPLTDSFDWKFENPEQFFGALHQHILGLDAKLFNPSAQQKAEMAQEINIIIQGLTNGANKYEALWQIFRSARAPEGQPSYLLLPCALMVYRHKNDSRFNIEALIAGSKYPEDFLDQDGMSFVGKYTPTQIIEAGVGESEVTEEQRWGYEAALEYLRAGLAAAIQAKKQAEAKPLSTSSEEIREEKVVFESPLGVVAGARPKGVDVEKGWKFHRDPNGDYFSPGELKKDGEPVWGISRDRASGGLCYYCAETDVSSWFAPDGIKESAIDAVTRDIPRPSVAGPGSSPK